MLNDLSDFTMIKSGKFVKQIEKFDVRQCVQDVVNLVKTSATSKGLSLETSFKDIE